MAIDYAARFRTWSAELRSLYATALAKLGPDVSENPAEYVQTGKQYAATLQAYQRDVCRLKAAYINVCKLPATPDNMKVRGEAAQDLSTHLERMRDYMTGFVAGSPTQDRRGLVLDCEVGFAPLIIAGVVIVVGGLCWASGTIESAKADAAVAKSAADSWERYYALKLANPDATVASPLADGKRATPAAGGMFDGLAKAAMGLVVVGAVGAVAYQLVKKS